LWSLLYEKIDYVGRSEIGGFHEPAVLFYSSCVLATFHYLHDRDFAYRDLKPENLLISADGFLKVVDFGFAKKIPFLKDGAMCKGHNQAADYWALGILVYELFTGGTPFADPSQVKIFEKIKNSKKYLQRLEVIVVLSYEMFEDGTGMMFFVRCVVACPEATAM
jgi:serine/threonine protein kinase